MKVFERLFKVGLFALLLAVGIRFSVLEWIAFDQDALTDSLCDLVSLPLETGLVRETHESLETVLKARGEKNACVSVVDNGRSFSPDCLNENENYRAVVCKAKGNRGIRASIFYPQLPLLGRDLLFLWAALTLLFIMALKFSERTTSLLVAKFSDEVARLLYPGRVDVAPESLTRKFVGWALKQIGVAHALSVQAQSFHQQIRNAEEHLKSGQLMKERLEIEADQARRFKEKIDRIHHDIRSPMSSLQSIHEKLSTESNVRLGRVLANAIKRIQESMDDIGRTDNESVQRKLVIADVIAEEVVALMSEKFCDSKSATLYLDYDVSTLSTLSVEPSQFRAVLENLIENALDAISVEGEARLRITRVNSICEITIEDTGVGISDEAIENLGLKSATFGKVNGNGLGLYNSVKSVKSWEGSLTACRLDVGSRFTIRLPISQTGVVFTGLPVVPQLLVIDDDTLTAELLTLTGYDILKKAQTYNEGRILLADEELNIDVPILVDHRLDSGNLGTDLIAGQTRRRNVYLCTNDYDDLDVVKRAKAIGVRIIPKPLCFYPRQTGVVGASGPGLLSGG